MEHAKVAFPCINQHSAFMCFVLVVEIYTWCLVQKNVKENPMEMLAVELQHIVKPYCLFHIRYYLVIFLPIFLVISLPHMRFCGSYYLLFCMVALQPAVVLLS